MPKLEGDDRLDEAIMEAVSSGRPVRLDSVTDFEWDEVALFSEGTLRSEIEAVVGETGLRRDRYTSSPSLFVFRDDGEVVANLMTTPDYFRGEYGTLFGPDAQLVPDGEGGLVRLAG